jgi:SAM-dependent methyltransferase
LKITGLRKPISMPPSAPNTRTNYLLTWPRSPLSGNSPGIAAGYFKRVLATDGSADQIAQAIPYAHVEYRVTRAEDVDLPSHSVDLITSAQAVHWFDLDSFYPLVRRVAKPDGVFAVWMYHLPLISPELDPIVETFYASILAGFWPDRFHYLAARYRTLPFPFEEIETPAFEMQASWKLDQLAGFLDTWSAVRRYQSERGQHPLQILWPELAGAWGQPDQPRLIRWPLYLRAGKIN